MFFLFIITISFIILLYKSLLLPLKPLPPWAHDITLLSPRFWKDLSFFLINKNSVNNNNNRFSFPSCSMTMPSMTKKRRNCSSSNKFETTTATTSLAENMSSVLDLPELVLESILEKLPPDGLCRMACVCSSLRERCVSDHLWERHMKQKWGSIIGSAARREWRWQLASRSNLGGSPDKGSGGSQQMVSLLSSLSRLWPICLVRSTFVKDSSTKKSPLLPDSVMSWYRALETGKFSFPAQVYNRENGHVGFLLSCYDAELCYDSRTDTFEARYEPHGRRAIVVEKEVSWERIRAPPLDTATPHHLYTSDCLNELRPGDHVEIQWRRNKEFPYGWWYGVVGHLESCEGNDNYCTCHHSDSVVLEFKQYESGSRWRSTTVSKKEHRESGNESDGFYGGIRKLEDSEEILRWKQLWPPQLILE